MNDFETSLQKLSDESVQIQTEELQLQQKTQLFNQKFMGFLKENGLPENFTLPGLALLAVRKARA